MATSGCDRNSLHRRRIGGVAPGLPACAQGGPIEQRYWNFYRAGQLDAALAEARKLRELVLQRLGEVHPNYAMVLNYEANVLEAQGRIRDAEVLYKRALAIDESLQGYEPNVARDLSNPRHQCAKTAAL